MNVVFEKTTGYNSVTASLIDKEQNAYKPKPMLMYMNEGVVLPTPIKFFDGTNYNSVSTYRKFSNELITGSTIASLNWGEEQSVNNPNALASNGLFFLWYKNYIGGLYDIRCRILNLKTKGFESEENPEGIVYRVERKGKVDFLAKWVRSDFPTGIYCIHVEEQNLVWNASLN